jgi:hypothetical protein
MCFAESLFQDAVDDFMEVGVRTCYVVSGQKVVLEQCLFEQGAFLNLLSIEKLQPIVVRQCSKACDATIPIGLEGAQLNVANSYCLKVAVIAKSSGSIRDHEVLIDVPRFLSAFHVLLLGSNLFFDDGYLSG